MSELLAAKVYTNNLPKLTPEAARRAARAIGKEVPPAKHSKDEIPSDVSHQMVMMQEQLSRVLSVVDTLSADNERLKAENAKLAEPKAQEAVAPVQSRKGKRPSKASSDPEIPTPEQ